MKCVDETCIGCAFLGYLGNWPCCDYIEVTGTSRGCKPGRGCKKRLEGEKRHSLSFSLYGNAAYKKKLEENAKKERLDRKHMTPEEIAAHERERKKREAKENRENLAGRQRAALLEYKDREKVSSAWIADMIGVHESTVHKWMTEERKANWNKLGILGIQKPEGV